jgi:hypothetical protein
MLKKIVMLCAAVIFSINAFADMNDKTNAKIIEVYINSGGTMLIKVEGINGYLALGKVGNRTAEIMYSTALSAKVSTQNNLWIRYYDVAEGHPTVGIISIK